MKKIGIITGSLRRASYSKSIARAFSGMLAPHFETTEIDIDLPLFNQDYDDDNATPPAWQAFRRAVQAHDGFVFVTPEYNRSVPPVLKNALDIASRPPGSNCWQGKPGVIIGVSPGKIGGFGACGHLRQTLCFLDVRLMNQPEVYIGGAADLLSPGGDLADSGTRAFLQKVADAYVGWISS